MLLLVPTLLVPLLVPVLLLLSVETVPCFSPLPTAAPEGVGGGGTSSTSSNTLSELGHRINSLT